jgi:hypothetical protein
MAMSSYPDDSREVFGTNQMEFSNQAADDCSVSLSANQALRACRASRSTIKSLRENLINCPLCPLKEHCELQEHFNLLVDQAVSAIIEEWGW